MQNTTFEQDVKKYRKWKKVIISLLIAYVAFASLYLFTTPLEAKAFDMNELEALVTDLTATAEEVNAVEANVDPNSDNFVADTEAYGNKIKAIAEGINSKRPEIEGIANEINGETKVFIDDNSEIITTQSASFLEGANLETITNAVSSVIAGEDVYSKYEIGNKALQVAGLQDVQSPITEVIIQGIRSILGLTLVSCLFSIAKSRIGRDY